MTRTIKVLPVFIEAVRLMWRLARDKPVIVLLPAVLFAVCNYLEIQVLRADIEFTSMISKSGKIIGLEIAGAVILSVMAIAIHRLALLPRTENSLRVFAPVGRLMQYTALIVVAVVLSNLMIAQLALDAFGISNSEAWPPPPPPLGSPAADFVLCGPVWHSCTLCLPPSGHRYRCARRFLR